MATPIFSYVNAKLILILSFSLNALALVNFTIWKNFILLALIRFLVGFCQVMHSPSFCSHLNLIDICMYLFSSMD
jgi:hypothetical protein